MDVIIDDKDEHLAPESEEKQKNSQGQDETLQGNGERVRVASADTETRSTCKGNLTDASSQAATAHAGTGCHSALMDLEPDSPVAECLFLGNTDVVLCSQNPGVRNDNRSGAHDDRGGEGEEEAASRTCKRLATLELKVKRWGYLCV